jgi:tetratricopeptide (TPR) repeat protein
MKTKIICPSCKEVVETDDDLYMLYCPVCSKQFKLEKGKELYINTLNKLMKNAQKALFLSNDYQKASSLYQRAFTIDDKNYKALLGFCIAEIKCSTLRTSKLHETIVLLDQKIGIIFVNDESYNCIATSFAYINSMLTLYLSNVKERLSKDNVFYEEEGLKLYMNALKDVIFFKQIYLKIVKKFNPPYSLTLSDNLDSINGVIKELELQSAIDYQIAPISEVNPMLDDNSKELAINDIIFSSNKKIYHRFLVSIVMMIISIIGAGCGVLLIFLLSTYLIIGVPIAAIFIIIFFVFFIVFANTLKGPLFKNDGHPNL